jgi:hypothetical protein
LVQPANLCFARFKRIKANNQVRSAYDPLERCQQSSAAVSHFFIIPGADNSQIMDQGRHENGALSGIT